MPIFPRHLPVLALLAVLSPASAGIDSGGGLSSDGVVRNHCSIGSPFATLAAPSGTAANQTGLIEVIYLLSPLSVTDFDPKADDDQDGSSNLMEYLAGTDPGNATSVFRPQGTYADGLFQMPIPTIADRSYRIWGSRDMQSWTLHRTLIGNDSVQLFQFDETSTADGPLQSDGKPSSCFFRIQILIP